LQKRPMPKEDAVGDESHEGEETMAKDSARPSSFCFAESGWEKQERRNKNVRKLFECPSEECVTRSRSPGEERTKARRSKDCDGRGPDRAVVVDDEAGPPPRSFIGSEPCAADGKSHADGEGEKHRDHGEVENSLAGPKGVDAEDF